LKKDRDEASPLLAAAQAFDAELERFTHLTDTARQGRLDSQKALERAAEALAQIADCEEQMQLHARALMAALGTARELQESQAELASRRAEEVRQRTAVYGDLLKRFQALGTEAAELNSMGQRLSAQKSKTTNKTTSEDAADGGAGGDGPRELSLAAGLGELSQRMAEVAEHAQGLTATARDADFEDVARQADSLRQQLLAARNKVVLLHGTLAN
jgi:DNA repair exonuclease SbcCD ATPase subunit